MKKVDVSKFKVEVIDFEKALEVKYKVKNQDIKPAFGVEKEDLNIYIKNKIYDYGKRFNSLMNEILDVVEQVRVKDMALYSMLFTGETGKAKIEIKRNR